VAPVVELGFAVVDVDEVDEVGAVDDVDDGDDVVVEDLVVVDVVEDVDDVDDVLDVEEVLDVDDDVLEDEVVVGGAPTDQTSPFGSAALAANVITTFQNLSPCPAVSAHAMPTL
jgi:hypothetical protein